MNEPSGLRVTPPLAGGVTTVAVQDAGAASTSVSLPSTPGAAMVSGVSSSVV